MSLEITPYTSYCLRLDFGQSGFFFALVCRNPVNILYSGLPQPQSTLYLILDIVGCVDRVHMAFVQSRL